MEKAKPSEEELFLLVERGATLHYLCRYYEVGWKKVDDWLSEYEIDLLVGEERKQAKLDARESGQSNPKLKPVPRSRAVTRDMLLAYVKEKRDVLEIAEEWKVKPATVQRWYRDESIDGTSLPNWSKRKLRDHNWYLPPRKELVYLYLERRFMASEIAAMYGCKDWEFQRWVRTHKVYKGPYHNLPPTKSEVESLYSDHSLRVHEVAAELKINEATLYRLLNEYKIPKRLGVSQVHEPLLSKDELKQLYLVERLTAEEIADRYEVKLRIVRGWIKEYKLEKRSKEGIVAGFPPRAKIKKLYLVENRTAVEIAEMYNTTLNRVRLWLGHYKLYQKRGATCSQKI